MAPVRAIIAPAKARDAGLGRSARGLAISSRITGPFTWRLARRRGCDCCEFDSRVAEVVSSTRPQFLPIFVWIEPIVFGAEQGVQSVNSGMSGLLEQIDRAIARIPPAPPLLHGKAGFFAMGGLNPVNAPKSGALLRDRIVKVGGPERALSRDHRDETSGHPA
jgi:hypothetical protein